MKTLNLTFTDREYNMLIRAKNYWIKNKRAGKMRACWEEFLFQTIAKGSKT
jgi:hypothetical protein